MDTPKKIKEACERIWLDNHCYYPCNRTSWIIWKFKYYGDKLPAELRLRSRPGKKYPELRRKKLKYK